MIHSKLHPILAIAAFAALGAGCALEARVEKEEPAKTEQSPSDLTRTAANTTNTVDLRAESPGTTTPFQKPNAVNKIITTEHVLGGGGQTDDGPRPHPWAPTPESESKSSDNSGSGTGSSPTK